MSASPTAIADGVWRITRGFPLRINVFFVREEGGVAVFDTGHKPMGEAVRAAADALGGATRVVLGNPHADHRGGATAIGAPVHCHVDDRENVEGDGAAHDFDFGLLPAFSRAVTKKTFGAWDGGPLTVAATLVEGDRVGDFAVVHLPGHSPGTIGLWRAVGPAGDHERLLRALSSRVPVPRQAPARAASGVQLVDRALRRVDRQARRRWSPRPAGRRTTARSPATSRRSCAPRSEVALSPRSRAARRTAAGRRVVLVGEVAADEQQRGRDEEDRDAGHDGAPRARQMADERDEHAEADEQRDRRRGDVRRGENQTGHRLACVRRQVVREMHGPFLSSGDGHRRP